MYIYSYVEILYLILFNSLCQFLGWIFLIDNTKLFSYQKKWERFSFTDKFLLFEIKRFVFLLWLYTRINFVPRKTCFYMTFLWVHPFKKVFFFSFTFVSSTYKKNISESTCVVFDFRWDCYWHLQLSRTSVNRCVLFLLCYFELTAIKKKQYYLFTV